MGLAFAGIGVGAWRFRALDGVWRGKSGRFWACSLGWLVA